jgi:protein-S-isoprenylcysteine O-methyltransferase Ste14
MTIDLAIKLAIFLIVSAWLVYFSRASLRDRRFHGFYRFFAWECILGLFLLNVEKWYWDPFSPLQLVSWFLLFVSLFLVLHGVHLLRRFGMTDAKRQEAPLIGFEKTTRIVTEGAYRYIRHPLYSSLLFLTWGIFCKSPTWLASILALVATLLLVATARADEAECIHFFGPSYRDYMRQTKMFIPFLF